MICDVSLAAAIDMSGCVSLYGDDFFNIRA